MAASKIKLLLVDDHPVVRSGVCYALSIQPSIEIVGEATTGREALAKARELLPDVVLLDIGLPGEMSGFDTVRQIREELPATKVLMFSIHDEKEYVDEFVKSAADGYLLKNSAPQDIVKAIEVVYAGSSYLSPSISRTVLELQRQGASNSSITDLTQQEVMVLTLVAEGLSSKQIADKMCLSVKTIGKYRERIAAKLDLHSAADFTRFALTNGLVKGK